MTEDNNEYFTKIPNTLLDAFVEFRMPGEVRQVVDLIIRQKFGYHKNSDDIALSQFSKATKLSRQNTRRALKQSEGHNIIIVVKKDYKRAKNYRINKKTKTWIPFKKSKDSNRSQKRLQNVVDTDYKKPKSVVTSESHKRNNLNKIKKGEKPPRDNLKSEGVFASGTDNQQQLPRVKFKKVESPKKLNGNAREKRIVLLRKQAEEIQEEKAGK